MDFKTKPWGHQLRITSLLELREKPYFALFWDMGTGKTKQACDIIRLICYRLNRVPTTLIICPVVVLDNWKREIELHTNIPVTTISIIDGITKLNGSVVKNPQRKLKIQQATQPGKQIFIINPETIAATKSRSKAKRIGEDWTVWENLIDANDFEAVIVDEVHLFKNFKGTRTKALHKFSKRPGLKFRYTLTGTPILQDALDLWSQFYILDPNILGENYYSFRSQYFYDLNAGMPSNVHFPEYVPKDEKYFKRFGYNENEDLQMLSKILYQNADRVMKNQVLELPKMHYEKIAVPFTAKQELIYNDFKKYLVAFLDSKDAKKKLKEAIELEDFDLPDVMKADTAIVQTIRLQQIICGIFTNEAGEQTEIESNRLNILRELLKGIFAKDVTAKVIVWTVFKPTYALIESVCTDLGLKAVFLTGLQNKKEKQDNVDAFNNDPNVHVIIANQGAGGTGVNLTASNKSIYYSRSFNLAHDLQSEARNYRGGQTREVTRYDLVTFGTIDEHVLERLKYKQKNAEDILKVKEFNRKEVLGLI
jgi:DNA excision repair protein ERCC-6